MKANPEEFNIQNPLPFNPGWFMAPDTSAKFLQAVATSLDAFAIWALLLTAIGLSAAGGKRLTFGSAFLAVVTPWAILTLVLGVLATL